MRRPWPLILLVALLIAVSPYATAAGSHKGTASVEVVVSGKVRSDLGNYWVRTCDSRQCWKTEVEDHENFDPENQPETPGLEIHAMEVRQFDPVTKDISIVATIPDMVVGKCYSFEFHHDENGDGKMTRIKKRFLFVLPYLYPAEASGISNNIPLAGGLGAETSLINAWPETCVTIEPDSNRIEFDLFYFCDSPTRPDLRCSLDDVNYELPK